MFIIFWCVCVLSICLTCALQSKRGYRILGEVMPNYISASFFTKGNNNLIYNKLLWKAVIVNFFFKVSHPRGKKKMLLLRPRCPSVCLTPGCIP